MSAVSSLSPGVIRKPMRSPLEVLTEQAAAIAPRTGGLLQGEVGEYPREDGGLYRLWLDVLIPPLNSRRGVLAVLGAVDEPYPAIVDAELFHSAGAPRLGEWERQGLHSSAIPYTENRAATDDELEALIKKVFDSPPIASVIDSMSARAARQAAAG